MTHPKLPDEFDAAIDKVFAYGPPKAKKRRKRGRPVEKLEKRPDTETPAETEKD